MKTHLDDKNLIWQKRDSEVTKAICDSGVETTIFNEVFYSKEKELSNQILKDKVIVYDKGESIFLEKSRIIYASANGAYTKIFLENNQDILISKNLKAFTEKLQDIRFIRPHKSYLVNTNYIQKYIKGDGGYLVLQNDKTIPVSSRKRNKLQELIEILSV